MRRRLLQLGYKLEERYQIDELIAATDMSQVYTATDRVEGNEVAVKLLLSRRAETRSELEASAPARIDHPAVVPVLAHGVEAAMRYLILPLLHGETLADHLRRTGPLPAPEVLRVATTLCDAAHAAHRRGLVHRDLKPSNVFLEHRDDSIVVRVLDFGVAKWLDGSGGTKTGELMGTLAYMAPEQVHDSKQVTPRADVYSLGAIVYEMWCGVAPFTANTQVELANRVMYDTAPALASRRADTPALLDTVVQQALAKEPNQRLATAKLLEKKLGEALTNMERG